MHGAGAENGAADQHRMGLGPIQHAQGNERLVVVESHDHIPFPVGGFPENHVRYRGAFCFKSPFLPGLVHSWNQDAGLFVSEGPLLSRMGIHAGKSDAGAVQTKYPSGGLMGNAETPRDHGRIQLVQSFTDAHVTGDGEHPQGTGTGQHPVPGSPSKFSEKLRLPFPGISGQSETVLVHRRGDHGLGLPLKAEGAGPQESLDRRLSAFRRRFAWGTVWRRGFKLEKRKRAIGRKGESFLGAFDRLDRTDGQPGDFSRGCEDGSLAEKEGPARSPDFRAGKDGKGDLRTNSA
jgi:hypothetical protein